MENKVEIERLSGIDGFVGWIIGSMIIEWISILGKNVIVLMESIRNGPENFGPMEGICS